MNLPAHDTVKHLSWSKSHITAYKTQLKRTSYLYAIAWWKLVPDRMAETTRYPAPSTSRTPCLIEVV